MELPIDNQKQIQEIEELFKEAEKYRDDFISKDTKQLIELLSSRNSIALEKRDEDGELIAVLLASDRKYYQDYVETYGFLKYIIEIQNDPYSVRLPIHPDIFWLECAVVKEDRRGEGFAKELVIDAMNWACDITGDVPCILAFGVMTNNMPARQLAARCGFNKIDRIWTKADFADDGSCNKDFSWYIYYKIVY